MIDDAHGGQDFDLLSQRIHPAASRIEKLSLETPAHFIAFDLLADGDEPLLERPFEQRREALVALAERLGGETPLDPTPLVRTAEEAEGGCAPRRA